MPTVTPLGTAADISFGIAVVGLGIGAITVMSNGWKAGTAPKKDEQKPTDRLRERKERDNKNNKE